MTAHKSAKRRKPRKHVYPEPKPGLRLLNPQSECSTPELAVEMSQELLSALRKLGRRRKEGTGDDPPEAA